LTSPRWRAFVAQVLVGIAACGAGYLMVGCVGELIELTDEDMNASLVDMSGDGGGNHFIPDIQNDLNAKSCGLLGCHGPGSPQMPVLINKPTTPSDQDANYNQFKMYALNGASPDPTQSLVLLHLLPGGAHTGGVQLASPTDPVYLRWLNWIKAGAPK
jgi:hypothetical protein